MVDGRPTAGRSIGAIAGTTACEIIGQRTTVRGRHIREATLDWVRGFGAELLAALADPRVWFSFLVALLLGVACLALGTWAARRVGLLHRDAPASETLGVGLGSGLLMFAAWWATIGSGGRSAFTPVAIAFVAALVLRRRESRSRVPATSIRERRPRFSRVGAAVAAGGFVLAVGLIYGSTMAPSPRNGQQPIEYTDVAYYSALALNLNQNGTESTSYPSGVDSISGLPPQAWYHWGEIWIAAASVRVFSLDPVLARHYVALPLVLLAAAALTGTIVRRLARTSSRRAFVFGAAASLFLAPVPVLAGALYGWWAVGLLFGITLYGMSVIAALLGLYVITVRGSLRDSLDLQLFCGTLIASMLPTHIVVAVLALIGAAGVFVVDTTTGFVRGRRPVVSRPWRGIVGSAAVVGAVTLVWGFLTMHGVGGIGSSPLVSAFDRVWIEAMTANLLAAGVFLAIPTAWLLFRDVSTPLAGVLLGTMGLVAAGAIAWGARFADFDMFHAFFAAIAVFAIPAAAVAVWTLWTHLRSTRRIGLAAGLLVFSVLQLELGAIPAMTRLQLFGSTTNPPIPLEVLAAIETLPPDAKLAYSCKPDEEFAFSTPALVSIYAHTGRRVVPMCYELDVSSAMIGADAGSRPENPFFKFLPQHELFTNPATPPTVADIAAFMKAHGIGYIYEDADHPNSLVPTAHPIAMRGPVVVLQIE